MARRKKYKKFESAVFGGDGVHGGVLIRHGKCVGVIRKDKLERVSSWINLTLFNGKNGGSLQHKYMTREERENYFWKFKNYDTSKGKLGVPERFLK